MEGFLYNILQSQQPSRVPFIWSPRENPSSRDSFIQRLYEKKLSLLAESSESSLIIHKAN